MLCLAWAIAALLMLAKAAEARQILVRLADEQAHTAADAPTPEHSIQAAVNIAQPGDTIVIGPGIYRETIVFPRNGTAEKPIVVRGSGDGRTIVSGCEPVGGWTKHSGEIWKAPMPWTLGVGRNQVFDSSGVLIEARFPNRPSPGLGMYVSDLSPLWPTFGEFSIPKETKEKRPGRIVSKLLDGQPDNYWKGACYYGVHYEGWSAQTGIIESSKSGEIG